MDDTNKRLKVFLLIIYCFSTFCIISATYLSKFSVLHTPSKITVTDFIVFLALGILADSYVVKYRETTITTGFAITVTLLLLYGVLWTMIIKGLSIALRYARHNGHIRHILNVPIYKTLFNISIRVIPTFCGGIGYYFPLLFQQASLAPLLTISRIILFVFIFLLANTVIAALLVTFLENSSFILNYKNFFRFSFLDIVFMAPFGIILFFLYTRFYVMGVIVFMVPILMITYLFALYMED